MQERHKNRRLYFDDLAQTCSEFYFPYVQSFKPISSNTRVLEVGCGEGGNLLPFAELGCEVVGVDIAKSKIDDANTFFKEKNLNATFIASDVFLLTEMHNSFDVIICHDVIEHIGDKVRFLSMLKDFLTPQGIIFMSFPAWQMPFGGHQQICEGKLLSHTPYYHLLPKFIYKGLLKMGGESQGCIKELLSIKDTRCSIECFERTIKQIPEIEVCDRQFYFINPHYKTKFGLKPRKLCGLLCGIPYLRDFVTTSCFYLLKY